MTLASLPSSMPSSTSRSPLTLHSLAPGLRASRVARRVEPGARSHAVALTQTFAVPVAELWSAIIEPERVSRWFGRVQRTAHDPRAYRLPEMGISGRITRSLEPRRLDLTWEFGASSSPESTPVSVCVEPADLGPGAIGATYTLRHTVAAGDDWELFGPAATGLGWDLALLGLGRHLADPAADQLPALAGFPRTPEGRAFVRGAVTAWERAHLAAGADADLARAAARRTADFHLGGR